MPTKTELQVAWEELLTVAKKQWGADLPTEIADHVAKVDALINAPVEPVSTELVDPGV